MQGVDTQASGVRQVQCMPFIDVSDPGAILPVNLTFRVVKVSTCADQGYADFIKVSTFQQSMPFQDIDDQAGGRFVSVGNMTKVPCIGVCPVRQNMIADQRRVVDSAMHSAKAITVDTTSAGQFRQEDLLMCATNDFANYTGKSREPISLADFSRMIKNPAATNACHIMMHPSSGDPPRAAVGCVDFDSIGADVAAFDTGELLTNDQTMLPDMDLASTSIESSRAFAEMTCTPRSRIPVGPASMALIMAANDFKVASIYFLKLEGRDILHAQETLQNVLKNIPVFIFVIGAEEYAAPDPETRAVLEAQDRQLLRFTIEKHGVIVCLRRADVLADFYTELAAIKAQTPGILTPQH